ncbi:hypothetical protein C8F01DRAFT_1092056 [Mycena amicta]|nr:hypothetical protein C8F01DRAFT_1092056 [Mycena amicta]
MGRTALHLTQADRQRAARERVVKYNKSARGKASRSAQRQQRHARKLLGSVLGKVSPLPALLRQHAGFELPVDDTGFLDGYSADYDILNGRFRAWACFPIFPPPPSDVGINPDSAEYHEETRLIEAVLHGDYRKREQVHELELTQQVADMDPKLRLQWLREEYHGALQSWRYSLSSLGKHESEREHTILLLHLGWQARRALRLYHGITLGEEYVTCFVQWLPPPPLQACREGFGRREQRQRFWLDAQPLLATAKRTRRSCERKLGSGWHDSGRRPPRKNPTRKHGVRGESALGRIECGVVRHGGEIAARKREARACSFIQRYGEDAWSARESQRRLRKKQIEDDDALRTWQEAWTSQQQVNQRRRDAAQSLLCVSRS